MQLLRTVEYVFQGSDFILSFYQQFHRKSGVWFESVGLGVFLICWFLCSCIKSFPYCSEDIARDHQSKPEAAMTSAAPAQVWDAQKSAYVQAAHSPPHRGQEVTWNNQQNKTGGFFLPAVSFQFSLMKHV